MVITVALDMHAHNTPQLTLKETTDWDRKQGGRSPESEKPPNQPDPETIKIRADGRATRVSCVMASNAFPGENSGDEAWLATPTGSGRYVPRRPRRQKLERGFHK